jgi:hypothetical protein
LNIALEGKVYPKEPCSWRYPSAAFLASIAELSLGLFEMRQAATNKRRKDEKEAAHAN